MSDPLAVFVIPQPTAQMPSVRRITDSDPTYRFKRVWMKGVDRIDGKHFSVTEPGLYEITEVLPDGKSVTSYVNLDADGNQTTVTRNVANSMFPRSSQPRPELRSLTLPAFAIDTAKPKLPWIAQLLGHDNNGFQRRFLKPVTDNGNELTWELMPGNLYELHEPTQMGAKPRRYVQPVRVAFEDLPETFVLMEYEQAEVIDMLHALSNLDWANNPLTNNTLDLGQVAK